MNKKQVEEKRKKDEELYRQIEKDREKRKEWINPDDLVLD